MWDLEEQRGRGFKVIIQREREKPQKEELLWGAIEKLPRELVTELLYLELPAYLILLWCKKKIYIYIIKIYKNIYDSFLLKPRKQSLNQFFLLGSYFIYIVDFLSICK